MGAVDAAAGGGRPGLAAIGRADDPLAEHLLPGGFGHAIAGSLPASDLLLVGLGEVPGLFEGQRREGGDQQRALGGFDHPGLAVVDGGVDQGLRPCPVDAPVVASHQLDTPERADMRFAATRADQQQLSVPAAGQRGPAVIAMGQVADHPGLVNPETRSPGPWLIGKETRREPPGETGRCGTEHRAS